MYQQLVGKVTEDLPEAHRRRWSFYSMLPNLGIDVFPDQMDFFQVLPRGPGKCLIRGQSFALPDDRREMKIVRYLASRINRQVQRGGRIPLSPRARRPRLRQLRARPPVAPGKLYVGIPRPAA